MRPTKVGELLFGCVALNSMFVQLEAVKGATEFPRHRRH